MLPTQHDGMDDTRNCVGSAPPSLRVAVVTETYPPEVNGVALTMARMVDGLRARGHRVQLVRPRQDSRDQPSRRDGQAEILTPGLPIPGYRGLRFGLPQKRRLLDAWRNDPPDIVHVATEGPLGAAALAAARQLALPVSSDYHTNFEAYSRHYRIGWLRGAIAAHLRRFHNRAALTLVPTRAMARQLTDDGYRNVEILARGVDTQLFHPRRRSAALRKSWGSTDGDLVIAYVGRLAPEKNLQLVTEAFDAIVARHPAARLVFVGDGPSLGSLRSSHPGHVYAGLRRDADLAAHYASADLFLFPSLTETFGNVVPEALASGLGVVAFDCSAAMDLIDDGINGRTVPPGDRAAFVQAALRLADDHPALARMREAAAVSAARLDWELIHDDFSRRLVELVASRPCPPSHRESQPWRDADAPLPDSTTPVR